MSTTNGINLDFEPGADIRPIAWSEFRAELLAQYEPPIRARATQRQMRHMLDLVGGFVATTAGLNRRTIAEIIRTRPDSQSPNTTLALLRAIQVAANVAVASGYLRVSPFTGAPPSKWVRAVRPDGKRHLSREEIRRILTTLAADVEVRAGWSQWKARRLQALVAVFAYCGLRRSEGLWLRVEDLNLPARIIYVRPHADRVLKTATSAAPVPIPGALVPILDDWLKHRLDAPPGFRMPESVPWVFPGCRRVNAWFGGPKGHRPWEVFQAVAKRAGVGHATFQMLRRSLATHLEAAGVGTAMIARILRHSESVDARWYRQADVDNLRAATEGLEF